MIDRGSIKTQNDLTPPSLKDVPIVHCFIRRPSLANLSAATHPNWRPCLRTSDLNLEPSEASRPQRQRPRLFLPLLQPLWPARRPLCSSLPPRPLPLLRPRLSLQAR